MRSIGPPSLESNPQLSFATRKEDWTCLGQHKRQPEFPVVDSKESAWKARDPGSTMGWEDFLEKGMAIHSSILAWRIPWTEEPGGLQSMGLQRVWHDWETNTSSFHFHYHLHVLGFPGILPVKNPPAEAGDMGSIPELGRSPGEGNGNLLQSSCLRNPMDKGAWWAAVHVVAKSQT